jgi:hypothetical protein
MSFFETFCLSAFFLHIRPFSFIAVLFLYSDEMFEISSFEVF